MPDSHSASLSLEGPEPVLEAEELRERGLAACLLTPPVILDIGFGRGELLADLAAKAPASAVLGVEYSRKRVQKVARRVRARGLRNVRLVHSTAEYVLERALPPASIAACWINFPDPWPKKRHHKRRLIRPDVVKRLAQALEPGAPLHVATDHAGYADWIREVMAGSEPLFENCNAPAPWSRERPDRCETGYEAEFVAEGREIAYFSYRRSGAESEADR